MVVGVRAVAAAGRAVARTAPAMALVVVLVLPASSGAQTGVVVESDIHYATHGGIPLLLDVYLPPGRGPFPAVIVIPGGKWVEIDKTKHADVPEYFAEHGIAAFAITYRPATEFPYPAAVQDVSAAIRWVRAHADDYQVDPAELGAIGVSSGGHLAALVAARGTGPLDRGSRVAVVASWSGMMDLRPLADSPDEEMRSAVRTFLGCSTSATCADPARRASPIVYVDPSDPPMVLVNSTEEIVPVDQAESMGQALEDAGIQSDVEITQGGHGAGYGGGNKILDRIIPFVQAWIAGRDAPSTVPPGDSGQGGSDGGKGGVPPAPSAPPAIPSASPVAPAPAAGDKHQEARPEPARVVSVGGTSLGAVIVAVAMIALLLVVGQLLVIARLRRRVAALGSRVSEDAGPPTASAEGA